MPLSLQRLVDALVAEIGRRGQPLVVAIDGPSGSGKSTVASLVASRVQASVVSTDDFFAATIPTAGWDARSPVQRAADALDWRRLRREALEPLRAGRTAQWRAFDFAAGPTPDGTFALRRDPTERRPTPIVIVEGAYSCRPELADLIDLAVLVDAPAAVRRGRLAAREDSAVLAQWHACWDDAEAYYFGHIRRPATFDIVLTNGAPA